MNHSVISGPQKKLILVLALLITFIFIIVNCGSDSDEGGQLYNSEYHTIHISRKPGLGFCVYERQVVEATLTLVEDGALFEGTKAVLGDPETNVCINQYLELEPCIIAKHFGPIKINHIQLEGLHEFLINVPRKNCDAIVECDPCVIESISVDEITASTDCCVDSNFTSAFSALANFLDQLSIEITSYDFLFNSSIDPDTLTQEDDIVILGEINDTMDVFYIIDNMNDLDSFNENFPLTDQISFTDLDEYSYFLILDLKCPDHYEYNSHEYLENVLTITLDHIFRFDQACPLVLEERYIVFKAKKSSNNNHAKYHDRRTSNRWPVPQCG